MHFDFPDFEQLSQTSLRPARMCLAFNPGRFFPWPLCPDGPGLLLVSQIRPIFGGCYGYPISVDEVALDAAQDAAGPAAANTVRKRLARAYAARGDVDRARAYVDQALRDTQERGDQRGYASALKSQALLLVAAGRPRAAVECFTGVVSILRDLGRQRAEGLALINLADTLLQLDRFMKAAIHLEHARTILSTLDKADPYNAARAELSLARAHLRAGSHDIAETMATTALATMTRLGSDHQQATAHDILAELAEQAGSHQRADEHRATAAALSHDAHAIPAIRHASGHRPSSEPRLRE